MTSKLIELAGISDDRGLLVSIEANGTVPFEVKRVYYLTDLKSQYPRGFHAHKNLKQLAVCLKGSCRFVLDDGTAREEFFLTAPTQGLFISDMYWREMDSFSSDCVILVLASEHYDECDYIRDYDDFKRRAKNG